MAEPKNDQAKVRPLKTFNDPVYGFITIDDELIFQLIEHPYFQRLRRISQLGLTNLVYSGANHTRFQHAIGAMNLMKSAISVLRSKGIEVSSEEEQGAKAAILLHDIGHGPFSHALENTIVEAATHEAIGLLIMQKLNEQFDGALDLAIAIYKGDYHRQFLHQLVSSQLDTDRLDYLKRDSFFTGVSEGIIGSERLIKMMTIHDGSLAIEAKGIYSLEKFLLARRLMYWQVYLHKTVLSAEFMLMNILLLAKELATSGEIAPPAGPLGYLLSNQQEEKMRVDEAWLQQFLSIDDLDVMYMIKQWSNCNHPVLSKICKMLINRRLLKTKMLTQPLATDELKALQAKLATQLKISVDDASYLLFQKSLSNQAYEPKNAQISVKYKDGTTADIAEAATLFRFTHLEHAETKHYLYFPADFDLAQ